MAINLSTLVNQASSLQLAKAWINFNGTTNTTRASYNVSSVTKNATGDYTINFTTAMTDANYSASILACYTANSIPVPYFNNTTPPTTTTFRFILQSLAQQVYDQNYVMVNVFGN